MSTILRDVRRGPATLVAVLVAAVAGLFVTAGPAAAHVHVIATSPGVDQVVPTAAVVGLQFDQAVVPVGAGLEVRNAAGDRVDLGDARHGADATELMVSLPADVAPGAHLAIWSVAAGDGHVEEGAWTFVLSGAATATDLPTSEPEPAPTSERDERSDPGPSGGAWSERLPPVDVAAVRAELAAIAARDGGADAASPEATEGLLAGDADEAQLLAAASGTEPPLSTSQLLLAAALAAAAVAACVPLVREPAIDREVPS